MSSRLLLLLLVAVAAVVFLFGRRLEGRRDAEWTAAASALQGEFRPGPEAASLPTAFGTSAPWHAWARTGQLRCERAIALDRADPPGWLLDLHYSVHEARGEASPEDWHEQAVAVLRLSERAPGTLAAVDGMGAYSAAQDGAHLFVWKTAPGAGDRPTNAELGELLQQARAALMRLSPVAASGSNAATAGPAPAARRTPPR